MCFAFLFSERKPVTWAALASKGTGVPQPQSFPSQPVSHVSKPAPVRSEPVKPAEGIPAQAPQGQRAPRYDN